MKTYTKAFSTFFLSSALTFSGCSALNDEQGDEDEMDVKKTELTKKVDNKAVNTSILLKLASYLSHTLLAYQNSNTSLSHLKLRFFALMSILIHKITQKNTDSY